MSEAKITLAGAVKPIAFSEMFRVSQPVLVGGMRYIVRESGPGGIKLEPAPARKREGRALRKLRESVANAERALEAASERQAEDDRLRGVCYWTGKLEGLREAIALLEGTKR